MPESVHKRIVESIVSDLTPNGYLKSRESSTLEYRENFNFGQMNDYSRIMASFANRRGGYIVFGVKDSPRKPLGVDKTRFEELSQERITSYLISHYSPEINWDIGTADAGGKCFGYIYTYESDEKPVICMNAGEIFYRYRGESKRIRYPELRKIIDELRHKERDIWLKHLERISRIGPRNVAFVDLANGSIETGDLKTGSLVIDRALLDDLKNKVKFVERGSFSDTGGEPALKIIGEVQAVDSLLIPDLDPNRDYPYLQKQLAEKLQIRHYDVIALVWKYSLKGDKKYHLSVETSKSGEVHRFSEKALEFLRSILRDSESNPSFLRELSQEYQSHIRSSSG